MNLKGVLLISRSTAVQIKRTGGYETCSVTVFGQGGFDVEDTVLGKAVGTRVVVNLEFPILDNKNFYSSHFNNTR